MCCTAKPSTMSSASSIAASFSKSCPGTCPTSRGPSACLTCRPFMLLGASMMCSNLLVCLTSLPPNPSRTSSTAFPMYCTAQPSTTSPVTLAAAPFGKHCSNNCPASPESLTCLTCRPSLPLGTAMPGSKAAPMNLSTASPTTSLPDASAASSCEPCEPCSMAASMCPKPSAPPSTTSSATSCWTMLLFCTSEMCCSNLAPKIFAAASPTNSLPVAPAASGCEPCEPCTMAASMNTSSTFATTKPASAWASPGL
mmetsp:Transcript_118403/g.377415  ORF Transcript_118403/g.377415 Transcript_118403/m.377415 type:complete len:254 (+) Transcript_118403:363-1124(+)